MLVNFIGTRGTHPSSNQGTMSFTVDNKLVFDISPEFVHSFTKIIDSWNTNSTETLQKLQNLYGMPSFSKIEHIFITHLHYDHWGGLRHYLIWSQMFESSFREVKPLHLYIPKGNLELFQQRLKKLFEIPDDIQYSNEDFFLRYLLVEIDSSLVKFVRIHVLEGNEILKLGKYEIHTYKNNHFRGSISYKLILRKFKLHEDKFLKSGLPKGPLLSQLQRESVITFKNKKISVTDVFDVKKTVLGYSGDTLIDKNLLEWFNECTHLIHETTYFEDEERFHTDSHSSLHELVPKIKNFPFLQVFLAVHFSGRYKWSEIEKEIQLLRESKIPFTILAPKIGSVVYYEEKSNKTVLEEIKLEGRF